MTFPSDTPGLSPAFRRDVLLTVNIDVHEAYGLEIGAANNPIVPNGRCKFVDYADTETLRARFKETDYRHAEGIVDVDYVWSGSGSLSDIIGGDRFDYAIASHVIEHVPNPLGWLRGISDVLKSGAAFNLAIPDKRFTFDLDCPLSSLGELVEADLLNYKRPSPRQIFDSCYHGKAVDPGEPWRRAIKKSEIPAFSGDIAPQLAFDQAKKSISGDYFDSHCWVFTPLSFLRLISGACELELFDYVLNDYHPTIEGEFEFFINLSKPADSMSRADLKTLQKERIFFFEKAIQERDYRLALIMEQ